MEKPDHNLLLYSCILSWLSIVLDIVLLISISIYLISIPFGSYGLFMFLLGLFWLASCPPLSSSSVSLFIWSLFLLVPMASLCFSRVYFDWLLFLLCVLLFINIFNTPGLSFLICVPPFRTLSIIISPGENLFLQSNSFLKETLDIHLLSSYTISHIFISLSCVIKSRLSFLSSLSELIKKLIFYWFGQFLNIFGIFVRINWIFIWENFCESP